MAARVSWLATCGSAARPGPATLNALQLTLVTGSPHSDALNQRDLCNPPFVIVYPYAAKNNNNVAYFTCTLWQTELLS